MNVYYNRMTFLKARFRNNENAKYASTSKQEFIEQCVPASIDVYLLDITGYWKIGFILNNKFEFTTTIYNT